MEPYLKRVITKMFKHVYKRSLLRMHARLTSVPDSAESAATIWRVGAELDPEWIMMRSEHGRSAVTAVAIHERSCLTRTVSQL